MKRSFFTAVLITCSFILGFVLLCLLSARLCYYASKADADASVEDIQKALSFAQMAARLNPLDSEYRYQRYVLYKQLLKTGVYTRKEKQDILDQALEALDNAIRLEPTRAAYHMYKGLLLLQRYGYGSGGIEQEAREEMEKACILKPYSEFYKGLYEKYFPAAYSSFASET